MELEEAFVRRAITGDSGAFEELVRRTSRFVYSKLYLDVGDAHLTEDLVQETFMRAFRSVEQLVEPSRFRGWLMTIANSVAIDYVRRTSRQRRTPPKRESQELLDQQPAPIDETSNGIENRERARKVLLSLPDEYRLPLTLRYLDGADYETISMQLGLTNGSLRGLLHRGLKLLRKALTTEVSHESQ